MQVPYKTQNPGEMLDSVRLGTLLSLLLMLIPVLFLEMLSSLCEFFGGGLNQSII